MSKKIKKTTNSQIHTPHDKLFKRSMKIPAVAREFLIMHLPDDIKHHIDYATLELLPDTFIDETLKQLETHPWAGTLEYIMHHRRNSDIRSVLKAIAPNIRMFYLEGKNLFVLSLYTYIENVYSYEAPVEEFARIAGEEISFQAKEDIMKIAGQMMNRGIEKGIEKGKIEIAQKMLDEGSNPAFIMKVTGLSLDKIMALQASQHRQNEQLQ